MRDTDRRLCTVLCMLLVISSVGIVSMLSSGSVAAMGSVSDAVANRRILASGANDVATDVKEDTFTDVASAAAIAGDESQFWQHVWMIILAITICGILVVLVMRSAQHTNDNDVE